MADRSRVIACLRHSSQQLVGDNFLNRRIFSLVHNIGKVPCGDIAGMLEAGGIEPKRIDKLGQAVHRSGSGDS